MLQRIRYLISKVAKVITAIGLKINLGTLNYSKVWLRIVNYEYLYDTENINKISNNYKAKTNLPIVSMKNARILHFKLAVVIYDLVKLIKGQFRFELAFYYCLLN